MKEHPILFSTEMVKAILDDKKTMTRRVIKPQPESLESGWLFWKHKNQEIETEPNCYEKAQDLIPFCPYGQMGDKFWIRETFCKDCYLKDGIEAICYKEDCIRNNMMPSDTVTITCKPKWTSGRFLPRKFARILLEITEVKVEKLQEISREDVLAEGVASQDYKQDYQWAFAKLWDSINDKGSPFQEHPYIWHKNPWVWCIGFRRIES